MDTQHYNAADNFFCQTIGTARSRRAYSDNQAYDPANPPAATPTGQFPKVQLHILPQNMGSVSGVVTSGGSPLTGVSVALVGTPFTLTTGADGSYSFPYVYDGQRQITCTKQGYVTQTQTATVTEGQNTVLDFNMILIPQVSVFGTIIGNDAPNGLASATVALSGAFNYSATTNAQGQFTIPGVWGYASYTYTVTKTGYQQSSGTINITGNDYDMGSITLNENANPVTNVVAVQVNPIVTVNWASPGTIPAGWIRWDSGQNSDSIGTGAVADFDIASRWPLENLADFVGQSLYAVEFWPNEVNCSYSVRVWTGGSAAAPGTMVVDQAIPNVTLAAFNTVVLTTPVPIPMGEELWFGIRCNASAGYPAGVDAGPAHDGLGNMMYFQGAWSTLLALAPTLNYDWNLAGYVGYSAPASRPLALQPIPFNYDRISEGTLAASVIRSTGNTISINLPQDTRSLQGFKVWRLTVGQESNPAAWTLLTPAIITSTTFSDTGWSALPDGNYKWAVKAFYTGDIASPAAFSNAIFKITQIGSITGTVRRYHSTIPISGATVTAGTYTATTNGAGIFTMQVQAGTYSVTCSALGYVTLTQNNVVVTNNQTTNLNFFLHQSGVVMDESFEGTTFPPTGWTQIITDTGSTNPPYLNTWQRVGTVTITPPITPPDGVWQAFMWWSVNHQDEWLVTPQFTCPALDPELRFNAYIFLGSPNNDHYYVKVSTDGGTNWTVLWDAVTQTPAGAYSTYTTPIVLTLAAYAGQNIKLAWHADDPPTNDGMWNVAAIDNVEVEGTVGVDNPETPALVTALNGNYPNPFNPETTISYSVKSGSPVAIEIYNTKGQRVRTLVNEAKAAGNYNVKWDGRDSNGLQVSSGVYFYKMTAGKFTSSRKMILLK
jgi:hypothetical protein